MNTRELEQALMDGPHAWPGGYPLYFVMDDGEPMSFAAVGDNFAQIRDSMEHHYGDGWRVVAVAVNWEDETLYCSHTGEKIPSAYGEA